MATNNPNNGPGDRYQGSVPFDFLWFTPRANDRDHCLELKRQWGKG